MKIERHWLTAENNSEKIVKKETANQGHNIDPDYLVVHYTAGDTAENAINWFLNTSNNPDHIAAHVVLDVDGTITQLVPFNRKANHAGYSNWDGITGFNIHAIGIEVVNPGYAEKLTDGTFRREVGRDPKTKKPVYKTYPASAASKIIKTKHKHKFWDAAANQYWFKFPQAQLDALYKISKTIINEYQLLRAVGHDDISPARKPDPGPAFPWDEFKRRVSGVADNVGKIFAINTDGSNFRAAPSTSAAKIKTLNTGYEVGLIETNGLWCKVYLVNDKRDVVAGDGSSIKTVGWVHSSLLNLKAT
jgi:N-acetylmuramoyl-L-alanine amidase